MLNLPIGLADTPTRRFPWMTLTIAVVCMSVFVQQPKAHANRQVLREARHELMHYWQGHPYLVPPPEIAEQLDSRDVDESKRERARRQDRGALPEPGQLTEEQQQFTALFDHVLDAEDPFTHRWGLVPIRGLAQPGWITSMFLHVDTVHLGGNLLLFAIVGPAIESLLGAFPFLVFYLVAGVLAGVVQVSLAPDATYAIIGASGAIAALMGLFTARFARGRVNVIFFHVPAVLCGGLWAAGQLWDLLMGGSRSGGVAVGAHLGGFVFGVGTASWLTTRRLQHPVAVPIEQDQLWREDSELDQAQRDLKNMKLKDAEEGFGRVLARRPTSADAAWGLAQIFFLREDPASGTKLLDRALSQWLVEKNDDAVYKTVLVIGKQIVPELLRPSLLARIARELETVDKGVAIRAYEVAAKAGLEKAVLRLRILKGDMALLEPAVPDFGLATKELPVDPAAMEPLELAGPPAHPVERTPGPGALRTPPRPEGTSRPGGIRPPRDPTPGPASTRLRAPLEATPGPAARIRSASEPTPGPGRAGLRAETTPARTAAPRALPEATPGPMAPPAHRSPLPATQPAPPLRIPVQVCALEAVSEQGLAVRTLAGEEISVRFGDISAITASVVASYPTPEGPRSNVLVTDFRLRDGEDDIGLVRVPLFLLPVKSFFPHDLPAQQAYHSLIGYCASRSHAVLRPPLDQIGEGGFPRFDTLDQLEAANLI
jgi:membrane associated rhomboid family serine protease